MKLILLFRSLDCWSLCTTLCGNSRHAGQAWVSLHLRLGDPPGPLHVVPSNPTRNGPSRQRRRARKEADRKQNAKEAKYTTEVKAGEAEEVSTNSVENAAKATEAESATIDEEAEVDPHLWQTC